MRLFVDASAIVAILLDEPGAANLGDVLDSAEFPMWSAVSCWETISAMRRFRAYDLAVARAEVESYAASRGVELAAIGEAERRGALSAYERFGKGTRHPARLNMGDCFAYACAKANGAKLLYKGDDFIHTDLA